MTPSAPHTRDSRAHPHMRLWVPGRARTKGSLRAVGRRANGTPRFAESVKGSREWRETVARAALEARGAQPDPGGWVGGTETLREAVSVSLGVWLPRPRTGHGSLSPYPDTRRRDDLDKLVRNVGDALTDAGIVDDDARIVRWDAWKVWATDPLSVGVLIEVWPMGGIVD